MALRLLRFGACTGGGEGKIEAILCCSSWPPESIIAFESEFDFVIGVRLRGNGETGGSGNARLPEASRGFSSKSLPLTSVLLE